MARSRVGEVCPFGSARDRWTTGPWETIHTIAREITRAGCRLKGAHVGIFTRRGSQCPISTFPFFSLAPFHFTPLFPSHLPSLIQLPLSVHNLPATHPHHFFAIPVLSSPYSPLTSRHLHTSNLFIEPRFLILFQNTDTRLVPL
jgi:hypothetical protein